MFMKSLYLSLSKTQGMNIEVFTKFLTTLERDIKIGLGLLLEGKTERDVIMLLSKGCQVI